MSRSSGKNLKTLFSYIAQVIYKKILHAANVYTLSTIRKQQHVQIHESFYLGEHSGFSLRGKIGQLMIEKQVRCRKFCNFLVYPDASLIIRENVFFNNFCSINCLGTVEIGRNTIFGESVKIYDHNHSYEMADSLTINRDKFKISKVKIGSNCWIGSNVTILMGVTIGDNVIVGANCLIHKSIPSNSIVRHKEELIITNKETD
jgi:acetyltransferase-like isoleucine patch superfamily enzyme